MVVARVGERLGVAMSPASLFAHPTVREQAAAVLQLQVDDLSSAEMDELMAQLSELSALTDEEAKKLLRDEGVEE
jgi:hypothetical protein